MKNSRYILSGHKAMPCDDLLKWAEWVETADRVVAQETVGKVVVSTVFLGLDYSFGNGPPLFFETMVLGGPIDQETKLYTTWDEAVTGHQAMVELVKAKEA